MEHLLSNILRCKRLLLTNTFQAIQQLTLKRFFVLVFPSCDKLPNQSSESINHTIAKTHAVFNTDIINAPKVESIEKSNWNLDMLH